MIPIALLEKFSSLNLITCIEVSHMTRHSSKSNKLRNINIVRVRTGTYPFKKKHLLCRDQNNRVYH